MPATGNPLGVPKAQELKTNNGGVSSEQGGSNQERGIQCKSYHSIAGVGQGGV